MIPKQLDFDQEGRDKLVSGITKLSRAVKSTLGPSGNTVLIESPNHTQGVVITKDGVTVAKSIDLLDPIENLAVRMMKEAADRTASSAGDGTTSSIVLTEALILNGIQCIDDNPHIPKIEILREMSAVTDEVVEMLDNMKQEVDEDKLRDVAIISANNDVEIGSIIAEVYQKIGKHGVVTVERSQSSKTYYETTDGIKVDRGYTSNLFVNNHRNDECILEDCHVLVTDTEISNIMQIENVLRPIIQENKSLLIIAPCSQNMINTLAANKIKNNLKLCNITPPSFGYKKDELMADIALAIGATFFSEKTGDDLSLIGFGDLGVVKRAIVGRDNTVLVRYADDELGDDVEKRIDELRYALENEKLKENKDFILSRIASLSGGIGVIYVGAETEIEQKELYDRVDDAVCAVRSALDDGILYGGGVALALASEYIYSSDIAMTAREVAVDIISMSIEAPIEQILLNAGLKFEEIYNDKVRIDNGYNVKTGERGNMIAMGVIDPAKVVKTALKNAVSVAVTILSTNAIVTNMRE